MQSKRLFFIIVLFVLIAGCSKPEKPIEKPTVPKPEKTIPSPQPKAFYTSKFTDKTNWLNGVNRNKKNQFYIAIPKSEVIPIKAGYILEFAMTGQVKVLAVSQKENGDILTIFITVDKPIDPDKDSTPNPFYIKGMEIVANRFTDNITWRNGIHLKKTGYFYFLLDNKDPIPIKVGSRIHFAKTGDAIVRDIFRTENPKNSSIFVGVDKALDPTGDGVPNPILILF